MALRPSGIALLTISVVLSAASCGSAVVPPSPAAASDRPSDPIATTTTSPAPSLGPSPAASVAASPGSPEPPPASLAAEGGDPVAGSLGSFTWGGGGSDSPWLPGSPVHVGAGERLTVTVAGDVGVAGWTARRVPAGSTDGAAAVGLGDGTGAIAFQAPPSGAWSVQLTVRFAGDLGSAAYYWRLDVD